jgi:hypothetical protein
MTDQHPPLTDLIGLDPNFTGGKSVDDYLRDQYCDGPHLDEAAIREDERAKVSAEIATAILAHYEGDTTALPNSRRDLMLAVARYAAHIARKAAQP